MSGGTALQGQQLGPGLEEGPLGGCPGPELVRVGRGAGCTRGTPRRPCRLMGMRSVSVAAKLHGLIGSGRGNERSGPWWAQGRLPAGKEQWPRGHVDGT